MVVDQFTPRRNTQSKYEAHMYYRRPEGGRHPGWITIKGSKGGKKDRYEERGIIALKDFGTLQDGHTNPWEQILTHPDGPAAFPVEQVIAARWYDSKNIPTECRWEGKDGEYCPVMLKLQQGITFPQLEGHEVIERPCPQCDRPPFVTVNGVGGVESLARHLTIIHGWDANQLKKYGDAVSLDFDLVYSKAAMEKTFKFGTKADFGCGECDWKPDAEKEHPARQLQGHKMGAHKATA